MYPELKSLFLLDPKITFLNFGSFGACPKPIFEEYQKIQRELEFEPVRFIAHDGIKALEQARRKLGDYLNADADDLVFVTNPSYGVNTIAKSFPFEKDDEILSTSLEYGALDRTWKYYSEKAGARYIQQNISLPIQDETSFLEEFWSGYTPKTKAIFISQITSFTGLILPVEAICKEAKKRNLITIIDGAHVPAHIPLDIKSLDPDVYVGACHKWMMSPKGASFMYVKKEQQFWVDPRLISWGYKSEIPSQSTFIDYHQTNGTRDYSAFLTVPKAIDFMEQNRWKEVAKTCREKTIKNAARFCNLMNSEPICPLNETFLGQMYSIPIDTKEPMALHQFLYDNYNIEIPVPVENGKSFLRYSIQAFNTDEDLDRLEDALIQIKRKGILL